MKKVNFLLFAAGLLACNALVIGCSDNDDESSNATSDTDTDSDTDSETDSDTDSETDTNEEETGPIGKWMVVLDDEVSAPSPGETITAKALLMEIDDDVATTIFLDAATEQVSGMKSTYVLDGSDLRLTSTHMWLGVDPEEFITYDGKGWYEIPDEVEPLKPSFIIEGDTLSINEETMDFVLTRTSFEASADLTGTWVKGDDSVTLNADGSMSFIYDGSSGSGTWEASGDKAGYLRQIYTEVSDDEGLSYREYLSPYTLDGNTLTFFYDFTTEGYSEEYSKE